MCNANGDAFMAIALTYVDSYFFFIAFNPELEVIELK